MSILGTALGGAARNLASTASGLALDVANGGVRAAEALGDRVRGRQTGPGVLPVEVLILSDEGGTPLADPAQLDPALALADRVFTEQVGVRVRLARIRVVPEPAPTEALDPRANRGLLLDDVLGRNAFYRERIAGSPLDVVGVPVTVVVVRHIAGHTTGCSLGVSADWVITESSLFDRADPARYDETVLAHELGHALNLPHHRNRQNLMFPASSPPAAVRGTALSGWQAALLRGNRHVIPGIAR